MVARLGLGSQQWPLSMPIAEDPLRSEAKRGLERATVLGRLSPPGLLKRNSTQTPPPTLVRPEGGLQFSPASTLC